MIEATVIDYLSTQLNIPTYAEQPEDMEPEFLVVSLVDESVENWIFSAVIAVQSYAETNYRAAEISEAVKNVMRGMEELENIFGCDLNNRYPDIDTEQKRYRYHTVFEITYHE